MSHSQHSTVHPHTVCVHTQYSTGLWRRLQGASYLSHSAISWHRLWISPSLGCAVTCVTPFTVMPSRNTAPWEENRGAELGLDLKGAPSHTDTQEIHSKYRRYFPNSCFFALWITVCGDNRLKYQKCTSSVLTAPLLKPFSPQSFSESTTRTPVPLLQLRRDSADACLHTLSPPCFLFMQEASKPDEVWRRSPTVFERCQRCCPECCWPSLYNVII